MKLVVCSVRDSALDAYMRPFVAPTTAIAVRSFVDEVKREQSEMHKHRDDYALYKIAEFDEESGRFENVVSPEQLIRGKDVE